MRITPVALLLAAVAAATLSAKEAREEPRAKPAPTPPAKVTPVPDTKPEPPRPPGQLANIRIDVKITDERSGQPATTKLASLTVADHRDGSIRSNSEYRIITAGAMPNMGQLPLNLDASPTIEGSHIRLNLGIEYSILDTAGEGKSPTRIDIRNRLWLVLDDAKPLRVTQSADPMSDRRVSLEVTATVLR